MVKSAPTKPLLIFVYGFPGAGKSHFARQLCDNLSAAHVQGDRIRAELFDKPRYDKSENQVITHLMDYMSEQFLNSGISVVYDVNAMRFAQRRVLRDLARRMHAIPLLVWVQIDTESAFTRVASRDRRRADDKYSMSLDRTTFDSLASHMQNPAREEDYIVISGKHSYKTQERTVIKKLREAGLLMVEDNEGRLVKPGLVNLIPTNAAAGRVDLSRRNIIIR
ncbi:MAG: AAA family ATPase [Candidatus Saccharimonadales bacterium]